MNKLKILTITTSGLARREGISTVILDYYSQFDKDKFLLDIVASGEYSHGLIQEFQNIGITVRYLPPRKTSIRNYINEFVKLIKSEHYDALYIHGSSALMSIELQLAKCYGINKRIVHSHNTTCDHKKADKVLRPIFYRSYTKALACGEDAGKWLYGDRPFEVIRNGRDISRYRFELDKRKLQRGELGLQEDTLAIGHVGNFNEQKNQKFLIDVLDKIVGINQNVKLYLMGDGRKKNEVIEYASKRGLEKYVVFTGSILNVPDMLQAMDAMLLPSLYEGLPLVAIEWQIAGLPCILSDCVTKECAYTDLVHFMSLDSPQSWAEEVLTMDRPNRQENAGRWAELTRENGYSLEDNVLKLQECFAK